MKVSVFPKMIEKLMREKKITQAELSNKLMIPPTTISQWCARETPIGERSEAKDHGHISKLLKYFNCSYEYLFHGEGLGEKELEKMIDEIKKDKQRLELENAMLKHSEAEAWRRYNEIKNKQFSLIDDDVNSEILKEGA